MIYAEGLGATQKAKKSWKRIFDPPVVHPITKIKYRRVIGIRNPDGSVTRKFFYQGKVVFTAVRDGVLITFLSPDGKVIGTRDRTRKKSSQVGFIDYEELSGSKKSKKKKLKTRGFKLKDLRKSTDEALTNLDKQITSWEKGSGDDEPETSPTTPAAEGGTQIHSFTNMPYTEKRKIKKGVYHFYNGSQFVFQAVSEGGKWHYKTPAGKLLGTKKKKKKGGLLKKLGRKVVPTKLVKGLYKNPLVKAALTAVPGVAPAMAAFDAARSKEDQQRVIESPEFQNAEGSLEDKIKSIGKKYAIEADDVDEVFAQLMNLKDTGKITAGSPDDQTLIAYQTMRLASDSVKTVEGATGLPIWALVAGGVVGLILIRKAMK